MIERFKARRFCGGYSFFPCGTTCPLSAYNGIESYSERMIAVPDNMHFTVAGGDNRLHYTAESLRERGYTVTRTKADTGED